MASFCRFLLHNICKMQFSYIFSHKKTVIHLPSDTILPHKLNLAAHPLSETFRGLLHGMYHPPANPAIPRCLVTHQFPAPGRHIASSQTETSLIFPIQLLQVDLTSYNSIFKRPFGLKGFLGACTITHSLYVL